MIYHTLEISNYRHIYSKISLNAAMLKMFIRKTYQMFHYIDYCIWNSFYGRGDYFTDIVVAKVLLKYWEFGNLAFDALSISMNVSNLVFNCPVSDWL